METRFAHLYKRDSSVSMIRVKMSRRRSQSQKENRERMQNLRRCLDHLPECELSMDMSTLEMPIVPSQEVRKAGSSAVEERKKLLARYKEQKALQKEKEKREKEKKSVFKFGLYRPQPLGNLSSNPVVLRTAKATVSVQSTRVTRSMKQQPQPKQSTERQVPVKKAEPAVRAPATRSSSRSVAAAPAPRAVVKPPADLTGIKTRSASRHHAAPSSGRGKPMPAGNAEIVPAVKKKQPAKEDVPAVTPFLPEEAKLVEKPEVTTTSFAPQGFMFQPPAGLRSFEPTPLSPCSADAFLSPGFEPKTEFTDALPRPSSPPAFLSSDSQASTISPVASAPPPASLSPPPASLSPPPASALLEPQHDVSYFREVMASETERLTGLSELWETRFDDSSVPEEMQDRMRTAVGQARLLMKERFGQFRGLVDDCDLGRGEKITTCSDLQGFWDMVYFQVEDVNKKFNALKDAEARGWKEETKTAKRKVVKKPPVVGCKPGAGGGASAAAKSRLAAVKAAMKAKQAGASSLVQDGSAPAPPAPDAPVNMQADQTVVFHGGFFKVESPAKIVGAMRRSSRLSAAPLPLSSPHMSKFSTPGRLHRSAVVSCASPLPNATVATPAEMGPSTASLVCTPQRAPEISPEHQTLTPATSPPVSRTEYSPTDGASPIQPDLTNAPTDNPVSQSPEIQPHSCPRQTEAELPVHHPEQVHSTEPEEAIPRSDTVTASSNEEAEKPAVPEPAGDLAVNPGADASPVRSDSPRLRSVPKTSPPQAENLELHTPAPSSPCIITTPQVLSPACSDSAGISTSERSPISANFEMLETPDAECATGLDFERYLLPAARCSLSPAQSPAIERFSLGAADVEMESPLSQSEERSQDALMTPAALPGIAPLVFTTPGRDQLMDNPLLWTPERRASVRQPVCDLMMFTPPSK